MMDSDELRRRRMQRYMREYRKKHPRKPRKYIPTQEAAVYPELARRAWSA